MKKPTKIAKPKKTKRCPGVLGDCGGTAIIFEDEQLCPKCIRTADE